MSSSLNQRIERVQRTAAQLLWLYGWSRFAVAAVLAITCLAAIDYLLRLQHPAPRWLLSALALASIIVAFMKLAWPTVSFRQNLVATARRIELCFPQLGERLSSATAFLQQSADDPTAGSLSLRRAVVAEAESTSAMLDFSNVLDSRPGRRAALTASIFCGAALLFIAINPLLGRLSLSRLAMPWRDQPWPRRHELAIVDPPRRVTAGADLEIAVIDLRGSLPDTVQLLVRQDSQADSRFQTHEMKPLGERMVFRLNNVTHDFAFRVRGGDDDTMPWHEVSVVEPPKLIDLRVIIEPPEYTGLPPQTAGRVIKGIIGSKLQVRGQLDKPIRSVVARSQTSEYPLPSAEISANGRSFIAPGAKSQWLLDRSGTLWFELADSQGSLPGRDIRLEVQAIADAPPTIAWETPAEPTYATAHAILPVKGLAKDDIAVRIIELHHRRGGDEVEQVTQLYAALPMNARATPSALSTSPNAVPNFEGDTQTFDYYWDLAQIGELAPGDELTVRITAEDNRPEAATTAVRRVMIISEEQLADRIATGQGAILHQLGEALQLARQVREQTAAMSEQLRPGEELTADELGRLQSAEHGQRQVQKLLDGSHQGVAGQLATLLTELAANRMADQAVGQRLNGLFRTVDDLNRRALSKTVEDLAAAFKAVREAIEMSGSERSAAVREVKEKLGSAKGSQDEVIRSLEKTLGKLSDWESFARLARDVGQIRADQQRLTSDTTALKLRALASLSDNSPPENAMARQLAQRQLELARSVDKLQAHMEEMLARRRTEDPAGARALSLILATARRLAIGGQMRQAADHLSANRFGDGLVMEQAALNALDQLRAAFSNSSDDDLTGRQSGTSADSQQQESAPPGSTDDAKRVVAELKRLLHLQENINRRTLAIEATRASGAALTSEQERELGALAKEEGQLAESIVELAREIGAQPETSK